MLMNLDSCVFHPELGEIPRLEKMKIAEGEWRDGILVRSPNWLGDAVMAIPAILQLKTCLPPFCGLFVACPKGIAPVFEAIAGIDRVVPLSDPHAFMTPEERRTVKRLQAGIGVLFNNSFRDALDLKRARIPRLFGAKARFRSLLLSGSWSFPKRRDRVLNKPHQAAKYLAMAEALGAEKWDGKMPVFRENIQKECCPEKLETFCRNPRILAIAGGAAYGAAKRWPAESFRELGRRWIDEEGGVVVTIGSKGERGITAEILNGLPPERCWNAAGETSMDELIYLLKHAEMCVANDSGVMHLAAALGVPGVAPFGCTDPAATSPLSARWTIAFHKIECAPCFKRVCPLGTKKCFDAITPEVVWKIMKSN